MRELDARPGFMRTRFAAIVLMASCILSGCATDAAWGTAARPVEPLVVFLVRHGEKLDRSPDPSLSSAGVARAATLAAMLRGAGLDRVYSSDYARTRETARPVADAAGLTVRLYDPRDLAALAKTLRDSGGRHLVVGHSNTTPAMVTLLGGEPGAPIDEASEFDRLYVVTVDAAGRAQSILLRYGSPGE